MLYNLFIISRNVFQNSFVCSTEIPVVFNTILNISLTVLRLLVAHDNSSLTPDIELNILIHGMPFHVITVTVNSN